MANYINGALGPEDAQHPSQEEQSEIEKGIAPERDAPLLDSASPEKEEMYSMENTQAFQPVMPVPVQRFEGMSSNIFGGMVPVSPGSFPVPGTNDGYGGNAVVRSDVPNKKSKKKRSKKGKSKKMKDSQKKQFIDCEFFICKYFVIYLVNGWHG